VLAASSVACGRPSLSTLDNAQNDFHDHYKYKHMEEMLGGERSLGRCSAFDRAGGRRQSLGSAARRSQAKPIKFLSWRNMS
jgi:hypothetical protein